MKVKRSRLTPEQAFGVADEMRRRGIRRLVCADIEIELEPGLWWASERPDQVEPASPPTEEEVELDYARDMAWSSSS